MWSGVEWCGVVWSGVEWRGVEWCRVEWRGVERGCETKGSKVNNDPSHRSRVGLHFYTYLGAVQHKTRYVEYTISLHHLIVAFVWPAWRCTAAQFVHSCRDGVRARPLAESWILSRRGGGRSEASRRPI